MLGSPFDLEKEVAAIAARRKAETSNLTDTSGPSVDRSPVTFGAKANFPRGQTINRR